MLPELLESHRPLDLVILMLGTNDCKTCYSQKPLEIGQGAARLVDEIQASLPQCRILLVSPILLGDDVWKEGYDPEFSPVSVETAKALPEVYKALAARRGIEFLAASEYAAPSAADQEHMDGEGHERLAKAMMRKVLEMFRQEREDNTQVNTP